MKKLTSTFAGTTLIVMVVVGAIAVGVWFCHAFIERFLATPHTISGVTISPYGHKMDGLLTHSFDSIKVEINGTEVRVTSPTLDITLLGESKGVTLALDTVDASIVIPKSEPPKKKGKELPSAPTFPENIQIPVPVKLGVNQANVKLSNNMQWSVSGLQAKNSGKQAVQLKIDEVKGDYVQSPASIDLSADFASENVKAKAKVKTAKDSVFLDVDAPKSNLAQLKTKTNVTVSDPKKWIPIELPEDIPAIGKLLVKADITVDALKKSAKYDASVKTHVGEFWPLLPEDVTINLKGDQNNLNTDIVMTNGEGGRIHISGDFDKNLDGTFEAQIENMNAKFGPQIMPLDAEIQFAEKIGNTINAKIETRNGSFIDGHMDFNDSLMITFVGDVATYEPWALDWTHGNVILKKPRMFGTFDMHKLRVLAKFDTVPYAYHMTADSAQVMLALDTKGIVFTNGILYTHKETFDFDGDVMWGTADPHTSWNVKQRHGGKASVYIGFNDTLTLDAKADHAEISTIPFADITISEKIKGKISGQWHQDFDNNIGKAELSVDGDLGAFNVAGDIEARQSGDTLFLDKAIATQNKNSVQGTAAIVLPNDSNPNFKPTSFLPIQVLHAWVSSKDFSIPLLLEPLNDTTLASGLITGELAFKEDQGLQGNLAFTDIVFRNIPPKVFSIKKMDAFAEGDKVELNSYLGIGYGGWTGNTQIIMDHIFSDKHHVSFSHSSDNGGTLWAEGFFDNNLMFQGTVDANGSWYIPKTLSEVTRTDLHIDINADISKGLKGITADIRSDSTMVQPPRMDLQIPFHLRGRVADGHVDISEAGIKNKNGETINATIKFDLDSMQLEAIDVASEQFTIDYDSHKLTFKGIKGHLEDKEDALSIFADIPHISYLLNDDLYGKAEALAHGKIGFRVPHTEDGVHKNNAVFGGLQIDKLVYYRDFSIDVTPTAIDKYLTTFNNYIAKLRKKEAQQEEKLSASTPIDLALHISDTQNDSIAIVTPFATFPLTIDVRVMGNTTRPLLRGDITNTNTGFIGIKDIYQFDLNSFQISWNDVPWQHGIIDVTSSQYLPYCNDIEEKEKESCPINFDIQGTITNPQPIPSSNCGMESSAAIYYNIFLGCIADESGENTDWNEFAGKAIGKVISTAANKTLGGDYIGDIEMKVMLFENTSMNEKDSSFFKIPISLDRWVKNLSLIFGYTQDQSDNPTYDQALQFGLNYTLPFFQEPEFSHRNHISPTLSLNAQLISKQYLSNTGTGNNENRVEKNIGINYVYRYWNPCLLGLGKCEDEFESKKETKKEKQGANP